MENIVIRLATQANREALFGFLLRHIGNDGAPLTSHLQLSKSELAIIAYQKLEEIFRKPDKVSSYIAIDKSKNQIVGSLTSSISEITDAASINDNAVPKIPTSEKFNALNDFFRLMWSGVREFLPDGYQGPYLLLELALIDPKYRRSNLWIRMMEIEQERAYKMFKCKYALGLVTNYIAQTYLASIGWRTLRWVNYEDYYVLGKKVFNFEKDSPHKSAKLMVVDIEEWLKNEKWR